MNPISHAVTLLPDGSYETECPGYCGSHCPDCGSDCWLDLMVSDGVASLDEIVGDPVHRIPGMYHVEVHPADPANWDVDLGLPTIGLSERPITWWTQEELDRIRVKAHDLYEKLSRFIEPF